MKRTALPPALGAIALALVGCESLTGLDQVTFRRSNTAAGAGGSGGAGENNTACGACDGKCVGTHCCRASGSFTSWSFDGGAEATTAQFVQFDGKGNLEAAFGNDRSREVWVHDLGAKGPVGAARVRYPVGPRFHGGFTFDDLDRDGYLDLVTGHRDHIPDDTDRLELRHGQPGYALDEAVSLFSQKSPANPVAYDVDGDGARDLMFVLTPGFTPSTFATRENLGSFTFGTAKLVDPYVRSGYTVAPVRGSFPLGGEAALSLDLDLKLLVPAGKTQLQAIPLDLGGIFPRFPGLADLDGDGDDDFLFVTNLAGLHGSSVVTFLRSGVSDLDLCEVIPLPTTLPAFDFASPGDYDFDGHADVLAVDTYNELFDSTREEHYTSKYIVLHATFP